MDRYVILWLGFYSVLMNWFIVFRDYEYEVENYKLNLMF